MTLSLGFSFCLVWHKDRIIILLLSWYSWWVIGNQFREILNRTCVLHCEYYTNLQIVCCFLGKYPFKILFEFYKCSNTYHCLERVLKTYWAIPFYLLLLIINTQQICHDLDDFETANEPTLHSSVWVRFLLYKILWLKTANVLHIKTK